MIKLIIDFWLLLFLTPLILGNTNNDVFEFDHE